jgi:hypothetical protein
MPRSSIKDEKQYEAMRDKGMSKQKAARIANSSAGSSRSSTGRKGGKSQNYEEWSKQDLYKKAKDVGIDGRSSMSKSDLIDALRNH